ncbi:MAG: NAD(P)-binding protein, partial [Myxococcales bacterium]|nr:NAD(P)-binding protein [Myxococcales bacterium]
MNDDEFRAALGDDGDAARLARQGGLDLDALTEGRGTIDTRVVVRVLPAAVVAAMLPAGLQLAPQPLVPPDHHPIFVSFAHNHFSAWFGEMDYHEVMLGIPWVEFAEERMPHRGPFIYMPRLYLDAAIPQILGERIYGYEKLAGEFTVDGDTWRVRDANGDLAVTASFERDPDALDDASGSDEELARAPEAWPHFAWVRKLLEQPTISQALRRFDRDARVLGDDDQRFVGSTVRYLTAGVDWGGRPVDATVLPILATVGFGDALTLPAGLPPTPERSASIAGDVLGAFRLRTKQVVSPPGSPFEAHYPPGGGRKLRVAVLGGGPSACAAAYYLARQRDAYEVSLYTMGWRLGGKCAAGRNRDAHDRIEEHGLHAFLGFYRNAIRTVGEVYRDAGRSLGSDDGPVSGALRPQANVGVLDRFDDRWTYFPTPMGPNDRVPGRVPPGASAQERPEGAAIPLGAILRRIADELQDAVGGDGDAPLDRVFSLLSAPWREAMTSL